MCVSMLWCNPSVQADHLTGQPSFTLPYNPYHCMCGLILSFVTLTVKLPSKYLLRASLAGNEDSVKLWQFATTVLSKCIMRASHINLTSNTCTYKVSTLYTTWSCKWSVSPPCSKGASRNYVQGNTRKFITTKGCYWYVQQYSDLVSFYVP